MLPSQLANVKILRFDTVLATPGGRGHTPPHTHTLCVAKKKGRQREKRKGLKAETIKKAVTKVKIKLF